MFTSLESSSGEPQRTPNIRAALSYAIEHDNVEEVRTLLRDFHTDSISTENEIHRTLSLAISCGRTQIVEILLQRDDVNPGFEDKNGRGPLAAAAVSGFVAIVKLLIEKGGANPNHKDCGGRTPLMWAITKLGFTVKDLRSEYIPDPWSTVQFLLNCDTIDVNARDSHGRTALCFAAMIGNKMCVHSLLTQHSIQPHITDDHGRTALSWAAEMGHTDVTSLLLSIRLDEAFYLGLKDNTGRTPLSWATTFRPGGKISISEDHRNCGVLKLLLEFAENDSANKPILDSDHQDRSALSFAVVNTWTDNDVLSKAVRLLLRSDSSQLHSMDQEGRTILSRAAECGRRGVMEQLLQCEGLNLNAKDRDGRTPLSVAAANGRCTMVEMILARSGVDSTMIDLNLEDEQQHRTALHFAAEAGHESIVRSLLACKDINTECLDISGHTPLALAALKHHRGIVRLLTEDKAIIQQLAREEGNLSYIRSLLKTGCDADSKDSYGHTPLHVATIWNQPRVVEELLRWDPAIDLEDASGLTPLRIAISTRCKDIVSMLLNHSASTIGVSPKDWYHVYDRQASHALLHFSQNLSAEKSVHLVSNGAGRLKLQPETDRHLVLFDNYASWCEHLIEDMKYPSKLSESHIHNLIQRHRNHVNIIVIAQYPVEYRAQDARQRIKYHWNECAIAWNIIPPSKSDSSPSWKSMVHLSMVSYDWIPASGIAFFTLLLQRLKAQWLIFCDSVDVSLSERRDDQFQAQGNSGDLIRLLAEDALNLARLRSVLRGQIQSATTFAEEYCQSYDREGGRRSIQDAINDYNVEASERIRQLEQTVMDLLHIEFAWVSSNEAHRSTSIATSVKRLSWITFIFLPAMFASSLFGMNVNILESNPDWRWFLLAVGVLLVTTILVWLFFKYGQMEFWIENSFGNHIQRLAQSSKTSKKRTLSNSKTL